MLQMPCHTGPCPDIEKSGQPDGTRATSAAHATGCRSDPDTHSARSDLQKDLFGRSNTRGRRDTELRELSRRFPVDAAMKASIPRDSRPADFLLKKAPSRRRLLTREWMRPNRY